MLPTGERLDVRVSARAKELVAERAEETGTSMNEVVNEAVLRLFGQDPAAHPVRRQSPGRKPNRPRRRGKSGKGGT